MRSYSVLLVDDDQDSWELMAALLRGSPYRLSFAPNGLAACERVQSERFDLIFMDMQMPVLDGLEATRAIRRYEQERGHPATPILALTANAGYEDAACCREAGCTAHLAKPLRKAKLLEALGAYLRPADPVSPP